MTGARAPRPWPAAGLVVMVGGRPPNLANARPGHWAERHRLARARQFVVEAAARSAMTAAGLPPLTVPARVEAIVRLAGTPRDPDNLVAGLKADLDGLVRAGALAGDGAAWCQLAVVPVRVAHRPAEGVAYRVVPLPTAPAPPEPVP